MIDNISRRHPLLMGIENGRGLQGDLYQLLVDLAGHRPVDVLLGRDAGLILLA